MTVSKLEVFENARELTGKVTFNNNWYLLEVPEEFHKELVEAVPYKIKANKFPHISIMKKEAPSLNQDDWGTKFVGEEVKFKVDPQFHNDNGFHVWINCYSQKLCEMRVHFGLPTLREGDDGTFMVNYHMTIGRRKKAVKDAIQKPYRRISPQTSIDVDTGMQFI